MQGISDIIRLLVRAVFAVGLIGGGAGIAVWLTATRPRPAAQEAAPDIPRVEVLTVQPVVFDAPIVGYGTVRPKRQVKINPEVTGRLVYVHPRLAVGNVISKDELLFQIDARAYEARVAQIRSEIRGLEVQLRRLEAQQLNLKDRLALAQRQEQLAHQSLERERRLVSQESGTAPELEAAEDRYLRQQEAVLSYRNQLDLIPLQIEETTALLQTRQAQHDEVKLSVEKTRILCPFDARVDSLSAQDSQVVTAHFQIAVLTDLEAMELAVVVDPRELKWSERTILTNHRTEDAPPVAEAEVTWTMLGQEFSWKGQVVRLERLDDVTRTAHVVVELRDVTRTSASVSGFSQPPLSAGMFCRAKLPTQPLEDALVIPRHALQEGQFVYVFEAEPGSSDQGRLALRRVPVLRNVGDKVLVAFGGAEAQDGVPRNGEAACELQPGDELIVSPLPKAVPGMLLNRRSADAWLARRAGAPGELFPGLTGHLSARACGVRCGVQ